MWIAIPSLRAAAAAMRTRFDCTAPVTSTVSAPRASASPKWNSSWRTLLPPKASPVQSSRLIQRSMPSAPPSFGAGSSGVGAWPSRARGKRAMPARTDMAGKDLLHCGGDRVRCLALRPQRCRPAPAIASGFPAIGTIPRPVSGIAVAAPRRGQPPAKAIVAPGVREPDTEVRRAGEAAAEHRDAVAQLRLRTARARGRAIVACPGPRAGVRGEAGQRFAPEQA